MVVIVVFNLYPTRVGIDILVHDKVIQMNQLDATMIY